jgi:hypothetical protein
VRVIVACEYSGRVRDAFIAQGHDAMSCDLLPTDAPGPHYQGDVRDVLGQGWDLMVCHPPCTYLTSAGLHWNGRVKGRSELTAEALDFIRLLMSAPIHKIALENPVGCISTVLTPPSQTIQPYDFGEDASKATCLWLKNLPLLRPTGFFAPRMVCCGAVMHGGDKYGCLNCNGDKTAVARWDNQTDSGQNKLPPTADRWKLRSTTYQGIADAMANQWGGPVRAAYQSSLELEAA